MAAHKRESTPMDSTVDPETRPRRARSLATLVEEAAAEVEELNPIECQRWLALHADAVVIDLREPNEYRDGAVPKAVHIPRGVLECAADLDHPDRDERLTNPDRPLLLYCRTGVRSVLAAHSLQRMGFTQVVSMAGGFTDWALVGGEVVPAPPSPFA